MSDKVRPESAEPSFLKGMFGALIPLALAVGVAAVGGFLVYLFWFGTGWLFE